ncbi:MAG TPA: thioredoxin domain-containing protein, partial [Acidobacteriota bacterium]|nr:thioredoxin domain-containing protein [Acidobacteriota bacterium]
AVKVDREERPDIDDVYMSVCQMMTGQGGWPLTIIMTPDAKPFFAGTYIPKTPRFGRQGLIDLLGIVRDKWATDRRNIASIGVQVTDALGRLNAQRAGAVPAEAELRQAIDQLKAQYDRTDGGFGGAPKFPMPHRLTAAIRWVSRTGDDQLLGQLHHTLRAMRWGGMYDQLGYGFHRYSTDVHWLVPHFEKMLYDNAGLAIAYTEMYQLTGEPVWRQVAEEIFTYVLRDMTSPDGVFYSAEDADSEGEEGTFYVWRTDEFGEVLDDDPADLARRFWGVTEQGNFEGGRSILFQSRSLGAFAQSEGRPVDDVRAALDEARARLLAHRAQREHPLKDDKVLTSWNGYMIAALAKAAQAFNEPRYADAAIKAADFILAKLRRSDGRLLRRYRDGEAKIPAFSDDYAYLIWGLIELYEATFEARYLEEALALNQDLLRLFWDNDGGGFFFAGNDSEELLVRSKDYADGALPSGNSVAALNLIRLGRMTGNTALEERAQALLRSFAARFRESPVFHMQAWWAIDLAVGPSQEIVIAADTRDGTVDLVQAVRERYLPRKVLLAVTGDDGQVVQLAPFAQQMGPVDGKAAAYLCRNYQCDLPVTSAVALDALLGARRVAP